MATRRVDFYLLKLLRFSGWFLFLLLPVYITSGYALCGKFGFAKLIGSQEALKLHRALDVPLVALFLAHSLPAMYLGVKRWRRRWTRRKAPA